MRSRESIKALIEKRRDKDGNAHFENGDIPFLTLEILLDIRDLLEKLTNK